MSPWEVIEEALVRKRPRRNLQWLADQIGVSIQVVSNWKSRGVPAKRYRDISSALGITVDQLEGLQRLPWEHESHSSSDLRPEVSEIAQQINVMPDKKREWLLMTMRQALEAWDEAVTMAAQHRPTTDEPKPSPIRHKSGSK
jgi:DNA-binding transcriptional regulator YdaS (Cro superfamily)